MKKFNRLAVLLFFIAVSSVFALSSCRNRVPQSIEIAILMYHDIGPEPVPENVFAISTESFRAQMQALHDAGFTTINFEDLIDFVDNGTRLPQNPIIITFDDGYSSNLELAAPILEEFGMNATINVVGISRGRDTYRNTDIPSTPHFSWDEVQPWVERGVINIGHHSYDMHRWHRFEGEPWRLGVLPMPDECEQEYVQALTDDFERLRDIVMAELDKDILVFAYPYGIYSPQSEEVLQNLGVRVTLTIEAGTNIICQGNPDSLFLLNRINMTDETDIASLILFLKSEE